MSWQPCWRPVAEQLLASPPRPMTRELGGNTALKQLVQLCSDMGARLKLARRALGVVDPSVLAKLEAGAQGGMVTISLTH
eukprot:5928165-Pyramimonas_sp.AAC.1